MRRKGGGASARHMVSDAFVFVLLGVFALFSVLLVLMGAQNYRGAVENAQRHADQRVLLGYAVNKVRMSDRVGALRVEEDALVFLQEIEGEQYQTRVYCHDGSLKELFMSADDEFEMEDGETLCQAQALHAQLNGTLLELKIVDADGTAHSAVLALRCPPGGEAHV